MPLPPNNQQDDAQSPMPDATAASTFVLRGEQGLQSQLTTGTAFEAGQCLAGRYVLTSLLGQGAMGTVWLARDQKLDGDQVAVKLLHSEQYANTGLIDVFRDEAKACLKLTHPHIVRLRNLESDADKGAPLFLVMDYIEGESLRDRIKRHPNGMPIEQVKEIAHHVAEAVDYAHTKSIIHRDIKPANILLEAQTGAALLSDFGIARIFENQITIQMPEAEHSSGTPYYMSPQQFDRKDSRRNDIYSFAATMYEAFSGHPPFRAQGEELLNLIRTASPPTIEGLPQHIEDALRAGLRKDDRERPESAMDLVKMMRLEPESPARVPQAHQSSAKIPLVLMLSGFIVTAVIVAIALLQSGSLSTTEQAPTSQTPSTHADQLSSISQSKPDQDTTQATPPAPRENTASIAGTVESVAQKAQDLIRPSNGVALSVLGQLVTAFVGMPTPATLAPAKPAQPAMSKEELREAVEILKAEQSGVTDAWVNIIEDFLSQDSSQRNGWKRWPEPFQRFELRQFSMYRYEDTGVIGLTGFVMTVHEKEVLDGRVANYSAAFDTSEIKVSPEAVAERLREDLRSLGVPNLDVRYTDSAAGPKLKVLFDSTEAHTKASVSALAQGYVFDPSLLDIQAY